MRRNVRLFVGAAALVLGALAALTWALLAAERGERAAVHAAADERRIAEALLRMDLGLQPILAGEAARWAASAGRPTGSPVTFLGRAFAIGADGEVQATGEDADALPVDELAALAPAAVPFEPQTEPLDPASFAGRSQMAQNFQNTIVLPPNRLVAGPFAAVLAGNGRMFLVRRAGAAVQGREIDWPALRRWLLGQIEDLLPQAKLLPLRGEAVARRLATLPVALEPGSIPAPPAGATSSAFWLLVATWMVVALALGAIGFALRAATELGERRALFVSSVTHELRTPLTTFRMYAQMLNDGMVPETARPDYIATLHGESERLCRIVESVLLYARLEDGRGAAAHARAVPAEELVARVQAELGRRCATAGCALGLEVEPIAGGAVHVDPQAVEQILLNLVDNAIKYADGAAIVLRGRLGAGELQLEVADGGPGIAAVDRAAIFRPFRRGVRERTGETPGLGLGLAIAHGLALAMGGQLELIATSAAGTTFRLRLPLVDRGR